MGQIVSRGPKRWLVRQFVSSQVIDGKRRKKYVSKMVSGTFAAAEKVLAALTTEVTSGAYVPPSVQTLGEFVAWWLAEVVTTQTEAATHRSYSDRIRPLVEATGHLKLDKASTPVLQRALNTLAAERKWSKRTTRYTRTILGMALSEAVRQGLLRSNPATSLILPRCEPVVGEEGVEAVWNQEQMQLYLERTKESEWFPVWNFLLNTGVRPGECAGLQWTDLKQTDIKIDRAVKSNGKKKEEHRWIIGAPKTKRSRRTISLPLGTLRVLREHRKGVLAGYIFSPASLGVTERADYLTIPQMHTAWDRDVRRSGMPNIKLYGARHTHATLLLSLGVPVQIVSERLGHTSVQITMDTYQHVLPHMQEEVASKLNAALGG
jgi:integrase